VTQENADKKSLENAGADKLMASWGGARSGLPFMVFLDPKGKKLADSNAMGPKKTNIGYPTAPEEIVAFLDLLKKTAPRMNEKERKQISDYLTQNAPKQNH
jgi:hypothetical protein